MSDVAKAVELRFDREGLVAAVRAKRETLGWSQDQLATTLGISKATLSRLLNSTLSPGLLCVIKLADWLDVPFDRFIERPRKAGAEQSDTVSSIEKLLLADSRLGVTSAAALARIVRIAHSEWSKEAGA